MSAVSRRRFLKLGACLAGSACAVGVFPPIDQPDPADAHQPPGTTLPYPRMKLLNVNQLSNGKVVDQKYPDASSPISLVKLGQSAVNGVGPEQDIVAFSRLCSHMGGTLQFKPGMQAFQCPLHYALFDPAKGGLTVIGQATDNLPQIELEIDAQGDIYAVGVKGLIYGRQANIRG